MSILLILAFLFFIGCTLGWCLEVFYRRFNKNNQTRRWVNPGFLTGPWLPLYGFGLCLLYLLASIEDSKSLTFVIMAVAMTGLEYLAGLIFIKGMKIKLWDYSNEKFNIQGIICIKFSIYWALLGAFYYFLIHPHILYALAWFSQNLAFSFFVGMFFGIFMVDLVYSLGIVAKVRAFAVENDILIRYELLKYEIRTDAERRKKKVRFIFSFASEVPLKEHLARYADFQKAFDLNPVEVVIGLGEDLKDTLEEKKEYIEDYFEDKIEEAVGAKENELREASNDFSDGYRWNK